MQMSCLMFVVPSLVSVARDKYALLAKFERNKGFTFGDNELRRTFFVSELLSCMLK